MLELWGATHVRESYADLGFRSTAGWLHLAGRGGLDLTFVLIGDGARGPAIALAASPPGLEVEAASRGHASDILRLPLLGEITIGQVRYQPGDFRFQRGWSTYPSDHRSSGPAGGWELVVLGDRRGARVRLAEDVDVGELARAALVEREVAGFFGLAGDLLADNPDDEPGPSALATTLGEITPNGRLDGSFADQECYIPTSAHAWAAFALFGDRDIGPVAVLSSTEPLNIAAPAARFDTEVFRIVLSGSCRIGGRIYEAGDARVQNAGVWCEPVEAGPDGLEEAIVLGDRRHACPELEEPDGWARELEDVVQSLRRQIDLVPSPHH